MSSGGTTSVCEELARLSLGPATATEIAERALEIVAPFVGAERAELWVEAGGARRVLATHGRAVEGHAASAPLVAFGRVLGGVSVVSARALASSARETLVAVGSLLGPHLAVLLPGDGTDAPAQTLLELRALQRVAQTASRTLDLDEVLHHCLRAALEVAHSEAGSIHLLDRGHDLYRAAVSVGETAQPPAEVPGAIARAWITSTTPFALDLGDPRIEVPTSPAVDIGYRSFVIVPLWIEREPIGFATLLYRSAARTDASTLHTLAAIAGQLATAIENARSYRTVRRRMGFTQLLREVAERALRHADPDEVYRLILDAALRITGGDRGLLSPVYGDRCRCVAGVGPDQAIVGTELPLHAPYIADALAHDGPLVVEDTEQLATDTAVGQAARRNGTRSFILSAIRVDQRPVAFLFAGSGQPRRFEPEELDAFVTLGAMAAEIVEHAHATAEAERTQRRLDAVIELLPLMVAVLDRSGKMRHFNATGREFSRQLFGSQTPWREALAQLRFQTPEGEPVPPERMAIWRAFAGEIVQPIEHVISSADGKLRMNVLVMAAPLPPAEGTEIQEIAFAMQDVSQLRALADAKDRFLRIASHELRSPVATLRATIGLLQLDPNALADVGRRTTLLERLDRQTQRLTRLIDQLLDSSRLNADSVPLQLTTADLVAVARESVELACAGQGVPKSRVELEGPPALEGRFDPLRVEQVLTNLVANALRYGAPGTPVRVRISSDGERGVVDVEDHGIGIPPGQLAEVFTPFFRASNAHERHKGGLGLGLYIASEIARRHGGQLRVASTLGQGSTFTLELPLAAAP